MRSFVGFVLAAVLLAVGGCAHRQVDTVTPLTGCDHRSGWCNETRETAQETWLYAQMAANAYAAPSFDLGPTVEEFERKANDDIGYAYVIFERRWSAHPPEWVIAYRGTENDTLLDWWNGNLWGRQNARGLATYDDLRMRLGPDAKISVAGHSLGGGIATYVSLCRANTDSYIFNSSPRFRDCYPRAENTRRSVAETGEVLKGVRIFGNEATQTYTSVNCMRGVRVVTQHSISALANCLTGAAAWSDSEARTSLTRNSIPFPNGLSPS